MASVELAFFGFRFRNFVNWSAETEPFSLSKSVFCSASNFDWYSAGWALASGIIDDFLVKNCEINCVTADTWAVDKPTLLVSVVMILWVSFFTSNPAAALFRSSWADARVEKHINRPATSSFLRWGKLYWVSQISSENEINNAKHLLVTPISKTNYGLCMMIHRLYAKRRQISTVTVLTPACLNRMQVHKNRNGNESIAWLFPSR